MTSRWYTIPIIALVAFTAHAQRKDNQERTLRCEDGYRGGRQARFCEMREQTLGSVGRLDIDARPNGGVSVKGWSRNEVLVRAKVQSWAETEGEAQSLVQQVRLNLSAGRVAAEGPQDGKRNGWSVSFEIFAPHRIDISAVSKNGGINLSDLEGKIEMEAANGGISLARLAGDVRGSTRNGGVTVELGGNRWEGAGLDVTTTNGGVKMSIPQAYSARLDTGTVNGHLDIDYPATVKGKISREMALNLGGGGAPLRVRTTNGGVSIKTLN
jgi:hypothetical protein